jgi:cell division protein FtsI (penicillin-binding protein 3)
MDVKKNIFWKAYFVYFIFLIVMLVVLFQTISIQLEGVAGVVNEDSSDRIPVKTIERIPRRGEILDVNYTPLVTTVTFYDIHMDATVVDQKIFDAEVTDLAKGLARLYPDMSAREYENKIRTAREQKNRYLLIRKKVTNEERKALRELPIFKLGQLKGGIIDNDEQLILKLTHGKMMRRTIGYYQNDGKKELKVGIEGAFNSYLSGEPGAEIIHKISSGWKKTGQVVKEAIEGADIVLSIDKDIQEVADSELERQLKLQGAKNGCVIVMDVKTGFVKAISNLTLSEEDGQCYEKYNFAIGWAEVPGSTFKLASLMAALEDEKININDTVNAYGTYTFYGTSMKDAHEGGYGRITIKRAFEKSSNVISQVIHRAYRNEPEAFIERLEEFGLTEPLGIDLEGEADPVVPRPSQSRWHGLSLPWMAVGYEVRQSPLQTLAFYNAVANGGTLVRPQFVKEIRRGSQVIKSFKPVVLRKKICSDETRDILHECLKGVMKDGGTGAKLTSSQFEIAGKTGTAVISNTDIRSGIVGDKKYQASFVGYFPASDPIYSCIVVISAPSKDIYGATVSGTVFAAVANKVYASTLKYHKAINENRKKKSTTPKVYSGNKYDLLKVFKGLNVIYDIQKDGEWLNPKSDSNGVQLSYRTVSKNTVPNLKGLTAKDAVYIIESKGMTAHVRGYGRVVKQSIPVGRPIFKGGVVELLLQP